MLNLSQTAAATFIESPAIADALAGLRGRIAQAAQLAGRQAQDVTLIAVSKTFPASAILAAVAAGQREFGENYVQEALAKIQAVKGMLSATVSGADLVPALVWHFIGPIQSNKTRDIAAHFDWVHGVEREKIAQRLSVQRPLGLLALNICIQVNISGEASKSGVSPEQVPALARAIDGLPGLKLRGLMGIPEAGGDPVPGFALLRKLRDDLIAQGFALDTLSMGMSGDFEQAIAEGATHVRVGSAIFGQRTLHE